MKKTIVAFILCLCSRSVFAQVQQPEPMYRVNRTIELSASLGLFAYNAVGFKLLNSKPRLDASEIAALNTDDIWAFDRISTRQSAAYRHKAADISDKFMNASIFGAVSSFV